MIPKNCHGERNTPIALAEWLCVRLAVLIAIILFCAGPTRSGTDPVGSLADDIEDILGDPALSSAHVGVVVDSLTTGRRLFEYNGGKRFVPASNMKLFTSAAALLVLSPDFRYETRLLTSGSVRSGVLHGDLMIEGSGDPTISGYFNGGDPVRVFRQWTAKLKQLGVSEIRGDLIIDNSAFSGQPRETGWDTDDATECFCAPRDAFAFNNNCLQLDITAAGSSTEQARIVMEPVTGYVQVINNLTMRTSPGRDILSFEYATPRTLLVNGSIGVGNQTTMTRYVAVDHPAYFGGFVFKETLAEGGIALKGRIVCARNCPKTVNISEKRERQAWKTAAVYHSPRLSEIIKVVNKLSNNLYAELVLFAIGKTTGDESAQAALNALHNAGIDTTGVNMADGSGLSRHNLVTPRSIVRLLSVMAQGPYAPYYVDSLPVMSMDGTLGNRLNGSVAAGKVRAKTGSMTHVRSLSGYVTARNNETLVFSILFNSHDAASAVDSATDKIILRLLDYPSAER